ncbi:MAG UNVERIFIED_CONTAM: hypothetical protein LVR18_04455 [Planctomycetaceae bacterium]|jgi:hypothetical protein
MRSFVVLSSLSVWLFLSTRIAVAAGPSQSAVGRPAGIEMIGEYLGIIESMDAKFERLIDADLKTAVALFEQAKASPNKSAELIHSARIYYTRAAEIQSDSMDEDRRHKRAIALLGLFACCKVEQDNANAERALRKISEIPTGTSVSFRIKCELQRPGYLSPHFPGFSETADRSRLPKILPSIRQPPINSGNCQSAACKDHSGAGGHKTLSMETAQRATFHFSSSPSLDGSGPFCSAKHSSPQRLLSRVD